MLIILELISEYFDTIESFQGHPSATLGINRDPHTVDIYTVLFVLFIDHNKSYGKQSGHKTGNLMKKKSYRVLKCNLPFFRANFDN